MKYAFGDSDLAAKRLRLLAEVFNDTSRAFIMDSVNTRPSLALDLGCGPGHTTHLMAETMQCSRVVGLDKSENFISLARESETEKVSFCLHDVTAVPFPVGPADVAFCRYLLTHLDKPVLAIARWADCLKPGGLLLMEEVEQIHTKNVVFLRYLEIVEAFLSDQGNRLYIGPILDSIAQIGGLSRRESRVASLRVSDACAAEMFSMNICSWKQLPYVRQNYSADEIQELEDSLHALSKTPAGNGEVIWGLRQIVFERTRYGEK